MTPVPPPDPEVMKNCRFKSGDERYFYIEWVPDGTGRRPLTVGDLVQVTLRGCVVGCNQRTSPDYKTNNLGTCKHVEALLEQVQADAPPHVRQRKAAVTRPEIVLLYGEQLTLALHLPPRHSD